MRRKMIMSETEHDTHVSRIHTSLGLLVGEVKFIEQEVRKRNPIRQSVIVARFKVRKWKDPNLLIYVFWWGQFRPIYKNVMT